MMDDLRGVHEADQATARESEVLQTASDVATYYTTLIGRKVPARLASDLTREFQSCWFVKRGIMPTMEYEVIAEGME